MIETSVWNLTWKLKRIAAMQVVEKKFFASPTPPLMYFSCRHRYICDISLMHIHIIPVNSHLLSLIIIARLGTGGPFTVDSKQNYPPQRSLSSCHFVSYYMAPLVMYGYVMEPHWISPHYSLCRQLDVVVKFTMVPKLLRDISQKFLSSWSSYSAEDRKEVLEYQRPRTEALQLRGSGSKIYRLYKLFADHIQQTPL